jgi:hypothetical protein
MKTIWKGILARGGRTSEPFEAEILDDNGAPTIIERKGVEVRKVSPHTVSGDAWMRVVVELASKAKQEPARQGEW